MLFSLTPKSRKDEHFNFEEELEGLIKSLSLNPITIVVGMRRTGKTSLLKVALNECKYPYIYMDPRFSTAPNYRDFAYLLKNSLQDFLNRHKSIQKRITDLLKNVKGVEIAVPGFSVDIVWKGERKLELGELFTALDNLGKDIGKPIVFAIDEAQELRKITWISFDKLLAYTYDNLKNIRIVLTGSEIGLLYKFLNIENPNSPLYGRYIHIIKTRRLSHEESIEFLKKGFTELKINIPENTLLKVVENLDGIIGWLTIFGYTCYLNKDKCIENIDKIIDQAIEIAKQELTNLLNTRRSPRYKTLLKTLTTEKKWSEIKKLLELKEGRTINDKTIKELLQTLIDLSIIEKKDEKYIITDPILRKAIEKMQNPP
ncbi:MAG: AAA family ATPase [Thermoprotei archaeon]|jgi:AAA+ ATPase superfamily predicted ATPase